MANRFPTPNDRPTCVRKSRKDCLQPEGSPFRRKLLEEGFSAAFPPWIVHAPAMDGKIRIHRFMVGFFPDHENQSKSAVPSLSGFKSVMPPRRSAATGRSRSGVLPCGGNVGNRITLGGVCLKKGDETPQSPLLSFVSEYIQGVVRETDHMVFHDFLTEILAKTPMLVDRISVTSVCIFPSINPGFKKTQAGKAAALLEGSARTQSSTISRCCSAES